jgi:hypothetical protein
VLGVKSCSLLNSYVEVLICSSENVTFFGNRVIADVIKLRRGHTGMGVPINTGTLIKERI